MTEVEKTKEEYIKLEPFLNETVKEHLPEPKNLKEIMEIGLKKPYLATNILAEVIEQIYNQEDIFVLSLVDDFNWLFRPTVHWAMQYADLKKLNHKIPPYHMALA